MFNHKQVIMKKEIPKNRRMIDGADAFADLDLDESVQTYI
jgi:hypothetical protein